MSSQIENDYEVNLKTIEEYKSLQLKKLPILLTGHNELPQNYKYTSPKLSKEGKFLTLIGQASNENEPDIVFIWNARHLNKKPSLKINGISKIEVVDFAPNENIFVLVYKDLPPVFFDYKEGKELSKCKEKKVKHTKLLSYSFSKNGKRFAMATEKDFIIYRVKNGTIKLEVISDDPIKVYRGEMAVFIDKKYNVYIMNIKEKKIVKSFPLTPIDWNDILSIILSEDKNYIYFMRKDGVFRISIDTKEIIQIKLNQDNIKKGLISEDCKMCMTTDLINAEFWDLENAQSIGKIYKEKFNSFSVNFPQSKLITCDNICIDLTDIQNDKAEQKFIWLDLNPKKFMSFSFSPDFKVLLAKIDEHSAISYNCSTGEVIKKWKINLPNWSRACEMAPEKANLGVIATKSYNKIIKIWDYLTGTDLSTFFEFDVNIFSFSQDGRYLAGGTVEGNEIARVWDLTNGDFYSYMHEGSKNNKNTFVNISKSEPLRVIAVAEEQNPIIFDLKEKQFLLECTGCPIQLSSISSIESNEGNKLFYIYGHDINEILTAILYDFTGQMINEYNKCRNIQFGKDSKFLLTDSDNVNKGLLTISQIIESNINSEVECEISGVNSKFLADNKNIATILDIDENTKSIMINNIENGENIAEIEYTKKTEKYTEIFISTDKEENSLIFRFIELRDYGKK